MADLTVGQPAVDALPLEEMAEAARAALPGNPRALLYTQTEGAPELIDVVRAKLRHYEGLDLDRDQIAITSGSSQALDIVLRTFTDLDGPLALDDVSYGAIPARRLTSCVDHIPFDDDGPQPEAVARHARALDRPFVFYTMPTFQNPMGLTVGTARRRELLEVCRAEGVPDPRGRRVLRAALRRRARAVAAGVGRRQRSGGSNRHVFQDPGGRHSPRLDGERGAADRPGAAAQAGWRHQPVRLGHRGAVHAGPHGDADRAGAGVLS